MSTRSKTNKVDLAGKRITLRLNYSMTHDPCAICGEPCDPDGFDYFLSPDSFSLVCDTCAEKYAPDMCRIKREVRTLHLRYSDINGKKERWVASKSRYNEWRREKEQEAASAHQKKADDGPIKTQKILRKKAKNR